MVESILQSSVAAIFFVMGEKKGKHTILRVQNESNHF